MKIDLFDFYRYILATVVTIYATVVTVQSLWTQGRERLNVTTVLLSNRKYQILLGELANVGTAAAVANAVYHATGKRVRQLPVRMESLL